MKTLATILCLALLGASSDLDQDPAAEVAAPRRAVLVTGASSGIGRRTTELLARSGLFVYAGARAQADLDALNALDNVQALRLDVTKPAEIAAAVAAVEAGGRGLHGLINNAGVVVVGPLTELPDADLTFQIDVNVMGVFRVTKAFAPLLIASGGRVSTTGSISGTVCWSLGGAYCISKHAVEAYTDTLAAELEPLGVKVSVVDPGNYRSDIMENLRERMEARGYTSEGSRYKAAMDRFLAQPTDRAQFEQPDDVAEAFLHAMTAERPKRRYMVVPDARGAEMTIRAALSRVVELNRDQPYAYSRERLVEMLDETLAASGR